MFEEFRIKVLGTQPVMKVSEKMLERIIQRDFGNHVNEVKHKLLQVKSDSQKGKNRISAAILKLANKDINSIERFIDISNIDSRDDISKAEYPRCFNIGFDKMRQGSMKRIYLERLERVFKMD